MAGTGAIVPPRAALRKRHARTRTRTRLVPDHARRARRRALARAHPAPAAIRLLPATAQQGAGCRRAARGRCAIAGCLRRGGRGLHRQRRPTAGARTGCRWRAPGRTGRRDCRGAGIAWRRRDHRRLLLRRPAARARRRRRRRRLHRVRRLLPVADQAGRTPCRDRLAARQRRPRRAAGGDRRHHPGQCTAARTYSSFYETASRP